MSEHVQNRRALRRKDFQDPPNAFATKSSDNPEDNRYVNAHPCIVLQLKKHPALDLKRETSLVRGPSTSHQNSSGRCVSAQSNIVWLHFVSLWR